VNHEDILKEMDACLKNHPQQNVWFHAGEFSDSLALSHLTGELGLYVEFCRKNPQAIIELRTKSANVREMLKLDPTPNFVISFSISPSVTAKNVDLKTPPIEVRLKAMLELQKCGWKVAAHFDPVIYIEDFRENYRELLKNMKDLELLGDLQYLSLGVVRFTKEVYREIEKNYPDSLIHSGPMIKSFDGKIRYNRPMRMWILETLKQIAIEEGVEANKVYFCMESEN
jgi:spore photoproduct lyase